MLFCCPVPLLQLLIIDKSSVISIYAGTNSVIWLLMSSFEQCYLFFRYGSLYAASLLKKLREDGVYMRPLGNVIYLMCGPCSSPEVCSQLLLKLYQRLEEFDKVEEKLKSCQVVMVLYCNNVWKPLVYSFLNVNLILYVLQIFASSVSLYPILESCTSWFSALIFSGSKQPFPILNQEYGQFAVLALCMFAFWERI